MDTNGFHHLSIEFGFWSFVCMSMFSRYHVLSRSMTQRLFIHVFVFFPFDMNVSV